MRNKVGFLVLLVTVACLQREVVRTPVDFYTSTLFNDVQLQAVFPDSKTFVDCTPKHAVTEILAAYERQKKTPGFDLKEFVYQNFELPERPQSSFKTDHQLSMREHITRLWPVLTRKADVYDANASLIPLPDQYIVPGGRFSEIYYWDSYFTMLGLREQGRYDLIEDMVGNFAFLIDSIGFIPNGNRNYYLSRSQPPFFSLMVKLLSEKDSSVIVRYLPMLRKEYDFWMHGAGQLTEPGDAFEHVVSMPDGTVMNRYYDRKSEPRPEAYKEDVHLAKRSGRNADVVYRHLRAAAESGWDFSSRWLADGKDLATIHTIDLIPVDLNCLLFHLELMIAQGLEQSGQVKDAAHMHKMADARRRAILTFCWDANQRFFFDYNFKTDANTGIKSLAGTFPLFFKIAQRDMANGVAQILKNEFLKPGGLTTTLQHTGQQWDAPNGWAPLQWMAYQGLKDYDHLALATEIRRRWIRQNRRVYKATGKMMEKYNVMDTTLVAGGGEYPNQDGFGWTNGVALAMLHDQLNLTRD